MSEKQILYVYFQDQIILLKQRNIAAAVPAMGDVVVIDGRNYAISSRKYFVQAERALKDAAEWLHFFVTPTIPIAGNTLDVQCGEIAFPPILAIVLIEVRPLKSVSRLRSA